MKKTKKTKKIKIFLGAYINITNAQNISCKSLAENFNKSKFEIYILESYSGDMEYRPIKGVNVFRCFYPHRISAYLGYLWGIGNCDVIFLPKHELNDWNQYWLKLLGKKSFSTVEGIIDPYMMSVLISRYGSKERAVESFHKRFDRLFSISNFLRDHNFKNHGICSEEKTLYLGTDIDLFLNQNKTVVTVKQVVMIGADLLRKGVHDFLDLATSYPAIAFHIVGAGNGRIDMRAELEKVNLINVTLHGSLLIEELAELLKNIDLHILPSRSEGFPKVILHAASAGIPSLVYPDYGAHEFIADHKDGFVVNTLDEMKGIIQELLDDPKLLQDTSKNAVKMAKRFDWKEQVKEWEEVVVELANSRI